MAWKMNPATKKEKPVRRWKETRVMSAWEYDWKRKETSDARNMVLSA
jgi:hypothetical protein